MTNTKYRVEFTEVLPGERKLSRNDLVTGDITAVQDHLDRFSWIIGSATVTEFVGSDAQGRIVPATEWCLD